VEESFWEGRVREDANKKGLESCHRSQEDIQTTKEKNLSQTSFGHISINSSLILTVSMATESP